LCNATHVAVEPQAVIYSWKSEPQGSAVLLLLITSRSLVIDGPTYVFFSNRPPFDLTIHHSLAESTLRHHGAVRGGLSIFWRETDRWSGFQELPDAAQPDVL